jgi:putative OPT family oligopeptide transporter
MPRTEIATDIDNAGAVSYGSGHSLLHYPNPEDPMSAKAAPPEAPKTGLPREAYEAGPGESYPPYIPAESKVPELTLKAVIFGVLIGIVFGAANAYLGLRVGMTVSASIPAAVMAIVFFRLLRGGTVLETNIVQTIGSAGESVAAGVIFTIPALFIWQQSDPSIRVDLMEISVLALLGGLLGVLFMIPLRRFLIVREHGNLPYPEGLATAEVQVAGESGGKKGRLVFGGLGIGALYQLLANSRGLGLWPEEPSQRLPAKAEIGGSFTPELLGVGFIVGPRIAAIIFGGGALGWLVLIPIINLWAGNQVIYPGTTPVSGMGPGEIWSNYIRYIGAGAVAFGGIITLVKSLPTIWESFRQGIAEMGGSADAAARPRTDRDIPFKWVIGGALVAALALWLVPQVPVTLPAAILLVIFAFFFVTVSSRIVGLVGSSSNPVSGMTITTLLLTAFIFVALGLADQPGARVAVLAVGAVVCIAAAVAGDTSQDLKAGFLLGATPWKQQVAEMIGVISSAVVMGGTLILLHRSYGIGVEGGLAAPQATLMSLVIDGVLSHDLPWRFVFIGMGLAAIVELILKLPSLAFAVGLYLPIALSTPIMVGGVIRRLIERKEEESVDEQREAGILFSSGLVGGAALLGVVIAIAIYFFGPANAGEAPGWVIGHDWMGGFGALFGTVAFAILGFILYRVARRAGTDDAMALATGQLDDAQ